MKCVSKFFKENTYVKKNHKKQFKVYEKNHKTSIKTVYLIILFYR